MTYAHLHHDKEAVEILNKMFHEITNKLPKDAGSEIRKHTLRMHIDEELEKNE